MQWTVPWPNPGFCLRWEALELLRPASLQCSSLGRAAGLLTRACTFCAPRPGPPCPAGLSSRPAIQPPLSHGSHQDSGWATHGAGLALSSLEGAVAPVQGM